MSTKKSIVFLTNLHLWSIDEGKGGKAFFHTVSAYIDNGWNVTIITTGGGIPASMRSKAAIVEKDFSLIDRKINSGNKLKSVLYRFIKLRAISKFYKQAVNQIIYSGKTISVIYSYEVEAVRAGKELSIRFGIPLVTRFQGTIISGISYNSLNSLKFSPHFSALRTAADLIIMTNDGTQGYQTLKRLGNNSEVVFWRNGIDKPQLDFTRINNIRQQLGIEEGKTFITVSRLVGWKRVHLAVEGFAEVIKHDPAASLIVIGDGPEKPRLQELARKMSCDASVHFMGAIRQQDVSNYLAASDIFVSFYDLSNLGNPIMEAMMVGKPIITINVGDTGDLIRHNENGILIEANSLNLIPTTMLSLLSDASLRNKISQGAVEASKRQFWSWEARMEAELSKVESLLPLET